MLTAEIQALLTARGPRPLVLLTIGNDLRGDDGVGPLVAQALAGQPLAGCVVLNAGEHPEGAFDEVVALNPGQVVILDAARFGGTPGEARLIPAEAVDSTTVSTHIFPPAALARLIEQDTGAPVAFLGIEPGRVTLGAPMSDAVRHTADEIVAFLRRHRAGPAGAGG